MPRQQPRLALVAIVAAVTWVIACQSDQIVDTKSSHSALPSLRTTWVSAQPCQISLASPYWPPPYDFQDFQTVPIPLPGSACGVPWHMFYQRPWATADYVFTWVRDSGSVQGSIATQFTPAWPPFYYPYRIPSTQQRGPLEITFDSPVKNVNVVMTKGLWGAGGLAFGHYMVALDSSGTQIGRADFDVGVDASEKTLTVGRIRKVVIYPAVVGYDSYLNVDLVDFVYHRASFAAEPPGKLSCKAATLVPGYDSSFVTRGSNVVCTVTGTGVVVTGWTWTGPSYENPNTILKVTSGPTKGNIWSGPAVTSGDVAARVTVNGVPRDEPLTASFTVKRRTGNSWTWGPLLHWKYTQGTGKNCGSGNMEALVTTIVGWNRRTGGCSPGMLTPDPYATTTNGYSVTQAPSGPNAGLWYVSALSFWMLRESQMNQVVMPNSGVTWTLVDAIDKSDCSANAGKAITKANFYFFNKTCKGMDVDGYIAGVWRHEGYGTTNGSGHQAHNEMTASLPEYMLYENEEPVFTVIQADLRNTVIDIARSIDDGIRINSAGEQGINGYNWQGTLFRWDRTILRFTASLITN